MPDLTVKQHGYHFIEFCELEKELKGPDPQLETIYQMCLIDDNDYMEMAWKAGVAVGVWNVPTAEIIWHNWNYRDVLLNPATFEDWLTHHWAGIFTRRERRCVRTPAKMWEYLRELAEWVADGFYLTARSYDDLWDSVLGIKYMGRYIAIKYLEFIRRYINPVAVCPDIRANGGWSPVQSLTLIYPDLQERLDNAETQREKVQIAEAYATACLERVKQDIPSMNYFDLQVMLCEYRTGYEHRHQYPGRSLDEELEFFTKVFNHWDVDWISDFHRARSRAFPHVALGEIGRWDGIRHELGTCLRDHGYLWSDVRYIYQQNRDLAHPFRRS